MFENLIVNLNTNATNYQLITSKLNIHLNKTNKILKTKLELNNVTFSINDNDLQSFILTSNYEQSLASKILKANYIQEQEKLIIIEFEQ